MARDPEGNLISPKLRADQQEVNSLYAQLPTHAEQGKQELERLFASGHERRDAGQTAEARERFVAAYLLARELTFAAGEAACPPAWLFAVPKIRKRQGKQRSRFKIQQFAVFGAFTTGFAL